MQKWLELSNFATSKMRRQCKLRFIYSAHHQLLQKQNFNNDLI